MSASNLIAAIAPVILIFGLGIWSGKHHRFDVSAALQPLAVSAAAVAIFASGVALAGHPVNLTSRTVLLGTFVCLVIQPLFFFAMIKFGGLTNAMAKATFVASVMPTGTPSVLFAQQYGRREAESATIMLLTTLAMPIVLPAAMALSNYV